MPTPKFLSYSQVINIHRDQINRFGGTAGVRDEGLLDSALAQAKSTFGGEFLHPTIHEQAAAYLFHLAKNHPFIDGNKRTAFAVMDIFLTVNGHQLNLSEDEAYTLVLQVAVGEISKEELSVFLQKCIQ